MGADVGRLCGLASLVTASRFAGPPHGRPSTSAHHPEMPLVEPVFSKYTARRILMQGLPGKPILIAGLQVCP